MELRLLSRFGRPLLRGGVSRDEVLAFDRPTSQDTYSQNSLKTVLLLSGEGGVSGAGPWSSLEHLPKIKNEVVLRFRENP